MRIKVDLYIFVYIVLFILTKQLNIYLIIMTFTLLHEIGHILCGNILRFKLEEINIMPFGFSIVFRPNIDNYNKKVGKSNITAIQKIIISLAGPLVNFIFLLLGIILKLNIYIVYSNLLLMIFNLLPIGKLDGGIILKNLLKLFLGIPKSYNIYNKISNIVLCLLTFFSSIIILVYKNIAIFLGITFLWIMQYKENKENNIYNKIINGKIKLPFLE